MQGTIKNLKAFYSPLSFTWHVNLDDVEFEVRYIMIGDKDARSHRLLEGQEIDYIWTKDILRIVSWKTIKQEKPCYLFDPDQPRNLAKSVTVR